MQEFQPVPRQLAGHLFGRGDAVAVPVPEEDVRCPRCDSANTKFCYYNNYNLSQPRHFCRGCRRYWTKGGLLRNVPVGGGCRKPKRQVPVSSSSDLDRNGAGAHRDAKKARSSSPASAASTTSNTAGAAAAAAAHASGGSATAAGVYPSTFPADARPTPTPTPRPMFADQEAAFASFFVSPLPAINFSPQPKAEDDVIDPALTLAEQPSSASCTADMAPFSGRPGGAAMASVADWPPVTAIDAGVFDLAGDTWSSYWNTARWTTTDPDGTVYLP